MLSKGLYLGSIIGGGIGAMVCFGMAFFGIFAAAITGENRGNQDVAAAMAGGSFLVFLLGFACILAAAIAYLVLWYKSWAAIQDGHARTTPLLAVLLMFIPLFNLYWAFQTIHGFAVDYNKYITRHGKQVPPLPEGLYLASAIMQLACLIPFLNFAVALGLVFVNITLVVKNVDAVNALATAPQAMAAQA
jgi:hypothetical protein